MSLKDKELSMFYKEVWNNLSENFNLSLKTTNLIDKKSNEKEFDLLINRIIKFIESFPKEGKKREVWRKKGNDYLDKIVINKEMFRLGVIDNNMKNNFIKSTKDFIKQAKNFNSEMSYEDIGQALRNVWIINILQKAFGEKIGFTNGIFGYSMLYPYTDNYLDDKGITIQEKKEFNNRFTKRLKGELINSINKHEEDVYKLVNCIELQFERNKYSQLYEKLLLIHEGQRLSLLQQEEGNLTNNDEIVEISIEKGGASVLVDGYLIRGTLSEEEEIFSYGYGFLLQLGDDLQDVKVDKENNHITMISEIAGIKYLDNITNKVINLTVKVIEDAKCFNCNDSNELKNLIKNNCLYMILFAIIDSEEYFSKEYIKVIEKYLPFTIEYSFNLKKNIFNKFKALKKEYNGFTVEEILLYWIQ